MAELLLLGTGAALADGSREPTMLALRGRQSTVLIDCGGNAVRQLQRLEVPLESLERVILTHSHPDHTAGFPLLVEMLWLAGRREPLPVHGPAEAIDVMRRVWAQWDTSDWRGLFELEWCVVPLEVDAPVALGADFDLTAAPGDHSVPVFGVRAVERESGGTVVYSADGEPSPGIQALARGADLLVHEATGASYGHSSAQGAARLAREAGARRLLLVHLAPQRAELAGEVEAARAIFGGEVWLGQDLERHAVRA
jgi:ribonuclease Z